MRFKFLMWGVVAAVLVTSLWAVTSTVNADFAAEQVAFFEQDVLPILQRNCFSCHGGQAEIEGAFRITSRQGILQGGELGPAVDLEMPGESELLSAVNYDGLEMPPSGKLPAEQIAVLTRWVKLGLPWSARDDYGVAAEAPTDRRGDGSDYWAYQPLVRPRRPDVTSGAWVANEIDAFVLGRLEAEGLAPNPPADKTTLIRRAYYDLTGLPPTPADVDHFLQDDSPEAFENLIDQLLESPQYGEHWGRHWLDLVRYAETHGYERDSPKPEAWRYRDYVIESLNQDKPYDRFVIEQLAGDELPDMTMETLVATGYYRLGLWDDEPVDRELARYDGLDDIVKTTSEVVLGTTMGCVRCHSHKADPIDHHEYYRFLAYFHDIADADRENLRRWVTDEDRAAETRRADEKMQREAAWAAEIAAIEADFRRQLRSKLGVDIQNDGAVTIDRVVLPDSRDQAQLWEYTLEKPSDDWIQPDYSTTSWDRGSGGFGRQAVPGTVVRTVWQTPDIWLRKWFEHQEPTAPLALDLHHDSDCEIYINGHLVHTSKGHRTRYLRVLLDDKAKQALRTGRNVIAIHGRRRERGQYIDAGLVEVAGLKVDDALKKYGAEILGADRFKKLADTRAALEQSTKRQLPPVGTPIMCVSEKKRGAVHVLMRGNPHAKGDQVEPAVPAAFRTTPPLVPDSPADGVTSGKRFALARWLFQPDNPLTARVIANRIWQHHFGRGIVPTPNDFGKLGEPLTHQQLLDWLACEIRHGGWRMKRIHKLIMLSSTWQMSSRANEQGLVKDPGNQYFWRFPMRRLSSEEVRDSMLAVTGGLNLKQGGPSIYVPIPQAVLQGQSRPGAGWGVTPPEEAARRSVYIHVKRSLLVPILEIHDQADTDSSCPVRYVTTVPTQSLGMLNGEFTNEMARRLATRLKQECGGNREEQVRQAIRLTTGRNPQQDEVRKDVGLLRTLQAEDQLSGDQALNAYCLLVLNANEFVYLD